MPMLNADQLDRSAFAEVYAAFLAIAASLALESANEIVMMNRFHETMMNIDVILHSTNSSPEH